MKPVANPKEPPIPFPLLNLSSTSCAPFEGAFSMLVPLNPPFLSFRNHHLRPLRPLNLMASALGGSQITVSVISLLPFLVLQWMLIRSRGSGGGTCWVENVDNGTTEMQPYYAANLCRCFKVTRYVDLWIMSRTIISQVINMEGEKMNLVDTFSQDLDKNVSDQRVIVSHTMILILCAIYVKLLVAKHASETAFISG